MGVVPRPTFPPLFLILSPEVVLGMGSVQLGGGPIKGLPRAYFLSLANETCYALSEYDVLCSTRTMLFWSSILHTCAAFHPFLHDCSRGSVWPPGGTK